MSGISDIMQPTTFRIILAATLVVPVLFLFMLATGFILDDPVIMLAIAIVIGYALACGIDYIVQSRTSKIAIATIAAIVSIILGSLIVRSMTMVCDPVHDPGLVCDPVHVPETTEPTVIATVQSPYTTLVIYDPVHEPGGCSGDVCSVVPGAVSGIVAQKLDECRDKLGP